MEDIKINIVREYNKLRDEGCSINTSYEQVILEVKKILDIYCVNNEESK